MDRCNSYNNKINKIKDGFEADLHKERLPVGVDDGHEGLHLPRHGHQLRDEARRALHRVLAVERGLVQIFLTPSNLIPTCSGMVRQEMAACSSSVVSSVAQRNSPDCFFRTCTTGNSFICVIGKVI